MSDKIDDILKYAKSLMGVKYTWWKCGSTTQKDHPFYVDKLPTKKYLKENGINCAGLINLLRLKVGKEVPGKGNEKGGTVAWLKFLKKKDVLEKFNYTNKYPVGTLFIRKYRNVKDQGHVAVFYSQSEDKMLLHGKIIHAYAYGNKGKVGLTPLGYSHFSIPEGYYEYAIKPENWLFK